MISSGGHVRYGEETKEAANRELFEELGLTTELKFIKKYKINYGFEREFVYVYFGITNQEPRINAAEVETIIFIPLDEFVKKYSQGDITFPPGSKDVCDLLTKESLLVLERFSVS